MTGCSLEVEPAASDLCLKNVLDNRSIIRIKPRKKSKKAEFGIITKQIFHRITYPNPLKSPLIEKFLWPI